MKFQAGNKDDDYDLGEDEDQPESEDNDLEQKRESLTRVFHVITLISVCTFSILFFIYFLRCWQGEFVQQSLKFYFWEEQRKNTLIKWSFSDNFWNQLGVCLRWTGILFCHRKESYCNVIFPPLNFNLNLTKAIHSIFSPSLISRKTTTSEKSHLCVQERVSKICYSEPLE